MNLTITEAKAKQKARQIERKERFYALARYWFGHKCSICGVKNVKFQFDHVNRSEKAFTLSGNTSMSIHVWWKELMKCQMLCEVCHKNKTATELGYNKHGTISMFKFHKCRCIECITIGRKIINGYARAQTIRHIAKV
jgi:5-methylcytosine-specific restriction endonuclease McrA